MKILLTGATGFIGSRLAKSLVDKDYEVECIIRQQSDVSKLPEGIVWHRYYQINDLYEIVESIRPNLVIHLAGFFVNKHSKENIEDLIQSNYVFPSILMDALNKFGCKMLINTGTYWQNYGEEEYNPVNLYAANKQAFRDIVEYYVRDQKWKAITLTMFDVYGVNDNRKKLLNIIRDMHQGESINLTSGTQQMCMCIVDDVVDAYIHSIYLLNEMEYGSFTNYSVRDDKSLPLKTIIEKFVDISNKNIVLNWGKIEQDIKVFNHPECIGERLVGWAPKYTIDMGLKKYYNDWRES